MRRHVRHRFANADRLDVCHGRDIHQRVPSDVGGQRQRLIARKRKWGFVVDFVPDRLVDALRVAPGRRKQINNKKMHDYMSNEKIDALIQELK